MQQKVQKNTLDLLMWLKVSTKREVFEAYLKVLLQQLQEVGVSLFFVTSVLSVISVQVTMLKPRNYVNPNDASEAILFSSTSHNLK